MLFGERRRMLAFQRWVSSLRVLHVYRTYFPAPSGGVQEAIRQIALTTKAQGVEPRVFALDPHLSRDICDRLEARVIRCRSWSAPVSCDLGGPLALRQFAQLVEWADLIHYHFPWPFADLMHFAVKSRIPAVMSYHSDIVRQRWLGRLYAPVMRKMLKSMRTIVASSPPYAKTSPVLTDMAISNRVRVIPLGIEEQSYQRQGDEDVLRRHGLTSGVPFFLFIGVLRYYKGLHTLVQAAANVRAKVVIAGMGPEYRSLQKQIERLAVSNVIFAGLITDAEKVTLLQRCHALVLPSHLRSEAYGMTLVEASMYGKPMLSCEIGTGTSFVNINGETGFVVPPNSPTVLSQAMNTLLINEALTKKLGHSARQRYELLFSGQTLGQSYFQLYSDVLNGKC